MKLKNKAFSISKRRKRRLFSFVAGGGQLLVLFSVFGVGLASYTINVPAETYTFTAQVESEYVLDIRNFISLTSVESIEYTLQGFASGETTDAMSVFFDIKSFDAYVAGMTCNISFNLVYTTSDSSLLDGSSGNRTLSFVNSSGSSYVGNTARLYQGQTQVSLADIAYSNLPCTTSTVDGTTYYSAYINSSFSFSLPSSLPASYECRITFQRFDSHLFDLLSRGKFSTLITASIKESL